MMMGIGMAEVFSLILLFGGSFGLPVGIPPAKEDPLLARIAPADCLFYTAWAGMAAPDPKSPNHTEQLLAEAEVQEFVADFERRVKAAVQAFADRDGSAQSKLMAEMLPKWGKAVLTKPTAIFLADVKIAPGEPPQISAGLMMNAGADVAELKGLLERLQAEAIETPVKKVTIAGSVFQQFQPAPDAPLVTWGVKGNYIVVGLGAGTVEAIFERAKGDAPKWLTEVRKSLPVERPSTVAYANVKKAVALVAPFGGPQVQTVIEALGFDNVNSYAAVTGLDQTGFVSKSLVRLDGAPKGLLSVLNAKPLTAADLATIPADAPAAFVLRLSPASLFDEVIKTATQIEPRAGEEAEDALKGIEGGIGIKVREDVIDSLGDVWQVYAAPGAGGLITGWTASVTMKNRDKLLTAHGALLRLARAEAEDPDAPRIRTFKAAGQDVYYLATPDSFMPFTPTWCLTADRVVVGLYPQAVKAHLARAKGDKSLAGVPEMAQALGGTNGPLMVSYVDTKEVMRLVYPLLQLAAQFSQGELSRNGIDFDISALPSMASLQKHLRPTVSTMRRTAAGIEFETRQTLPGGNVGASAPVLIALALPAVQAAREAARRMSSSNNLKQIGLAMHNHADTYRTLPAAYNTDKDGKPLLSWRVHILPFIEQQPLYEQFHFDEPWDSEHNKKLIARMPPVYAAPGSRAEPGKTVYLAIRGKSSIIVPPADTEKGNKHPKSIGFESIVDGTSNTVMAVEASDERAVIWTKPDDFVPDGMAPTKGLVGLRPGGFQALFADGSVRFLSERIDPKMFMNLFSRDDGNIIELPDENDRRLPRPVRRAVPAPVPREVPREPEPR